MRRFKLVASDFHLGAGLRNPDGSLNTMEDFSLDARFIEFLEHYSTGEYADDEVELILNGDIFNLLAVEVEGKITSEITEEIALGQFNRIAAAHRDFFDALRAFQNRAKKSLTFTIGNHDSGLVYEKVQEALKEKAGNRTRIAHSYLFDGVLIEHGDRYDPAHATDPRQPYIGRGLKPPVLNLPWASYFFIHFVVKLKKKRPYIDKVLPFRTYLTWAALFDVGFFIVAITQLFFFTLYTMLFARVGGQRFGLKVPSILVRQWKGEPEMRAAKRILRRQGLKAVLFGHTHSALYRQWEPGREYFNSGCWNGVTSLGIEGYGYSERPTFAFLEWMGHGWRISLKRWRGHSRIVDDYIG